MAHGVVRAGPKRDQLVFESSADQAGFVQMPNVVLMDATLTVPARLLYGMLLHFARQEGACFPGQTLLAAKMGGVTDRSVRVYLKELEAAMLVRREQRGMGKTCLYVLLALGLRAKRLAEKRGNSPEVSFRRKSASAQPGSELPAEVYAVEEYADRGVSAPARDERQALPRFNGKPVNHASWRLTGRVLTEYNEQAGSKLRLLTSAGQPSEAAKRIYSRVRAYPDLTAEEFAEIIRRTLASKWWGADPPTPGVVFGPKVFEDNITRKPTPRLLVEERDAEQNARLRESIMRKARGGTG